MARFLTHMPNFNRDLSSWDVSKVKSMDHLFDRGLTNGGETSKIFTSFDDGGTSDPSTWGRMTNNFNQGTWCSESWLKSTIMTPTTMLPGNTGGAHQDSQRNVGVGINKVFCCDPGQKLQTEPNSSFFRFNQFPLS